MTIADQLTIGYVKDEEFLVMRVGDEYLLLPGGSQRVFLGDCTEDVQAQDGLLLYLRCKGPYFFEFVLHNSLLTLSLRQLI